MDPIDLDHNATSPLDPDVFEAMRPHWFAGGNAESRHSAGRAARRAVIAATESVARILNAHPDEVIFTSGGTEANNLAIFGLARLDDRPGHIVSSPIEHPAVAEVVTRLESRGFTVSRPGVSTDGLADPAAMVEAAFRPHWLDTRLATLILAHNETGAIQPVAAMADRFADWGRADWPVPIHTDAVQAVGRIPVDFRSLGVQSLAASAHKFGGPAGVGLLLVARGVELAPLLFGGKQQRGLRPGTVPVALVVGLAAGLEKWDRVAAARIARWTMLRDRLERAITVALGPDRVVRNGPSRDEDRLPQTLNVGFPGLDGDLLLMRLDQAGVRASLGSACASGTTAPSPSLMAMRVPEDRLRSSVRFSLGPDTTEEQVNEAARRIAAVVGGMCGVVVGQPRAVGSSQGV